jgi:hypothetical protein
MATVTVTAADPFTPSLLARTEVVPAETARTSPLASTVATAVLAEDQSMARPLRTFPPASLSTAVARVLCETTRLDETSVTVMLATAAGGGTRTVIESEPLTPPLDAEIDTVPGASACTIPSGSTEATVRSLDAQETV